MGVALAIAVGLVLLLVVGVIVWGWRGVRLDDHPVCRGCGFDLFGRPEGSERCSECGRELSRRGAVRVGNRRRRWGWVMGAGVLLGVMVLGGGGLGVAVARKVVLERYMPVWLLGWELKWLGGRDAVVMRELEWRHSSGKLSPSEVSRFVDLMLDRQGNLRVPWSLTDTTRLELMRWKGQMSVEQRRRYLEQGIVALSAVARPKIGAGEMLAVGLHWDERGLMGMPSLVRGQVRFRRIGPGSKSSQHYEASIDLTHAFGLTPADDPVVKVPVSVLGDAGDRCELAVEGELTLSVDRRASADMNTVPPDVTVRMRSATRFDIVAKGAETVTAIVRPGLEEQIRSAIKVTCTVSSPRMGGGDYIWVYIEIDSAPEDLAYKIDGGEKDRFKGRLVCRKGEKGVGVIWLTDKEWVNGVPASFTLRLIPSREEAQNSPYVLGYADVPLTLVVPVGGTIRPSGGRKK